MVLLEKLSIAFISISAHQLNKDRLKNPLLLFFVEKKQCSFIKFWRSDTLEGAARLLIFSIMTITRGRKILACKRDKKDTHLPSSIKKA